MRSPQLVFHPDDSELPELQLLVLEADSSGSRSILSETERSKRGRHSLSSKRVRYRPT